MSRKEQTALVAFFNAFRLSRRITAFEQLSDGKTLMEVMRQIDATHFKSTTTRSPPSSSSSDNWVLSMNTLKRLYRLLLSFPLPSPHPSLSLTSLPEPPFTAIARSSSSKEGTAGLLQICRFCLSVGVWAPGNEKVIAKIQGLGESNMAALMQSIEEVMSTLPTPEEGDETHSSPERVRPISPPSGLRAERDKLLQENDELRARCETMITQVAEMTSNLEEAKADKEEALARLSSRLDASAAGLRTSQTATSEIDGLRSNLARAEDNLAGMEIELNKQMSTVNELTKLVDDYRVKAADASKLRDQLDEYRFTAERLQKSENVIEKYKKKLEDSAGIRRELRNLEEENSALVNTNASLEAELQKAGSSKDQLDNYRVQIESLENQSNEQANQIAELNVQLETARTVLSEVEEAHERDLEELQLHQERVKELEFDAGTVLRRSSSKGALLDSAGNTSLSDEIDVLEESETGETKTNLRIKIRNLQRELAAAKNASSEGHKVQTLESLLRHANKAKDRYQADYLEASRNGLRLQANLEQIRSGRGGDNTQTSVALRQRLDEVLGERDGLLKAEAEALVVKENIEKQFQVAKVDLSLVDKDQKRQLAALRETIGLESEELEEKVVTLKEEIATLKDKDRLHLEEIKKLLIEKVDLQSSGINQREQALEREKEFSDIRAGLAKSGVPKEAQDQMLQLHLKNDQLSAEVKDLGEKLQKAKDFIRNQDALFRADHAKKAVGDFGEAQRSYEAQIDALKDQLQKAQQTSVGVEKRYKLEQQLMLSAWHELGSRTVRDHIGQAGTRRHLQRPMATSWLGRQRRYQEEASFSR